MFLNLFNYALITLVSLMNFFIVNILSYHFNMLSICLNCVLILQILKLLIFNNLINIINIVDMHREINASFKEYRNKLILVIVLMSIILMLWLSYCIIIILFLLIKCLNSVLALPKEGKHRVCWQICIYDFMNVQERAIILCFINTLMTLFII